MATEGRRTARAVQERSISTRAELLDGAARVFSRLTYAEARLKDVADESGISAGSMYFHFGNKVDLAQAILQVQQERMTAALTEALEQEPTGLDALLAIADRLSQLIASDTIVQAGIKLGLQPGTGLDADVNGPYFEWIRIAESLIRQGVEDGSIKPGLNTAAAAEYVNVLFVGAQLLSEIEDTWASFPKRFQRMRPHIIDLLSNQPDE
ncbi:TetR/AcrR family transcriptional regulator [Herbiconiux ginsengi]|uniref:TetR/AcrR family transcriptional regulator n=1 Tax=Herbiconiux ginsengi TaxID=381665 RepID=UPI0011148771|nr:TetR/AcrR family transcriptional regulator [Herbiconiux ginsengi]